MPKTALVFEAFIGLKTAASEMNAFVYPKICQINHTKLNILSTTFRKVSRVLRGVGVQNTRSRAISQPALI